VSAASGRFADHTSGDLLDLLDGERRGAVHLQCVPEDAAHDCGREDFLGCCTAAQGVVEIVVILRESVTSSAAAFWAASSSAAEASSSE
jgi:hypothetical protein